MLFLVLAASTVLMSAYLMIDVTSPPPMTRATDTHFWIGLTIMLLPLLLRVYHHRLQRRALKKTLMHERRLTKRLKCVVQKLRRTQRLMHQAQQQTELAIHGYESQ